MLVSNGQVFLLSHLGQVIWGPVTIPGSGYGGAPTIADFDGDGTPEIGVAGGARYVVFRSDGSIKWQTTIQDSTSSATGSSVFDFDGDGAAEVIYGDELNLRIYRGNDGAVLYTLPKSSCTTYELPIIADVDADGRADIVAVANQACGFGPQKGILVISGSNWVNTRRIWNQHSYHITNVNDDATIPKFEQSNWLTPGLNNFRLNTFTKPEQATAAPDFTSSNIRKNDLAFPASVQLTARVGNGGGGEGTSSSGPNLIHNGGFEEGCPAGSYIRVNPGSPTIPSWTVVKGQVDWQSSSYPAYEGSCSLNLEGDVGAVGGAEQTIATTPGVTYEVSFRLHADTYGPPPTAPMRVSAAGASVDFMAVFTIPIVYVPHTWRFVASGASTTLRFESTTTVSPGFGPVIDAVAVRPISGNVPANLSFYRGDPASGGTLLGRTRTTKALAPGEFEDVTITWANPPVGLHQIFAVADDPAEINEVDETNNKVAALALLGTGPFPLVDELLTRQKANSVDLSWVAISGASGYNIYRRTGSGTPQLIKANQTGISFTDIGLTNGTPVFYTVRWRNAQGQESADGTEASATPTATGSTGANTPTILSRALTRAVVGNLYSYPFRATDPDAGTVLTYALVSPPAGMVISNTGLITGLRL